MPEVIITLTDEEYTRASDASTLSVGRYDDNTWAVYDDGEVVASGFFESQDAHDWIQDEAATKRIERFLRNSIASPIQPRIASTHGGGQSYSEV